MQSSLEPKLYVDFAQDLLFPFRRTLSAGISAKAVFLCSQETIPGTMPRRAERTIIALSVAEQIVRTGQIPLSGREGVAIHFARCLAVEVAPHEITLNCICPGTTDPEMLPNTARERRLDIGEYAP